MIWGLIDQFVYVSIILFAGYISLYKVNKVYAALVLIVVSLMYKTPLFLFVFPFIVVATIINIFFKIHDLVKVSLSRRKINKMEIAEFIAITIIVLIYLSWFSSIISFSIFKIINISSNLYIISIIIGLHVIFKEYFSYKDNKIIDTHYIEKNQMVENIQNNTNKDDIVIRDIAGGKDNKLILITIAIIIISIILLRSTIFQKEIEIDISDYIFLEYDSDAYVTDVEVLSYWDEYDKNFFYDEREAKLIDEGYTDEEITHMIPMYGTYSEEIDNVVKKMKFEVSADKTENLIYGDEVTINVNYNLDNAKKNNINIVNTHFTLKVDRLKHKVEKNEIDNSIDEKVEKLLLETINDSTTIDTINLNTIYYYTVEDDAIEKSHLVYEYDVTGVEEGFLFDNDLEKLYFDVEVFKKGDKIDVNEENKKISYKDGYIDNIEGITKL